MDRGPRVPFRAQSRTWPTLSPDIRNPASSTGLWRLQLSTTVKIRNGRPSARVSCTKSILHRSVGPAGVERGLGAAQYASAAGPACEAANPPVDRVVELVSDLPTSLRDAGAPRCASTQNAGAHGPDLECVSARPFDPSRGFVDTRRPDQTAPTGRPARNSPRTSHETTGRAPGGRRASNFFSQGLRQHVLVE
jgi:hypothetical protein